MNDKQLIASRAAALLKPGWFVNLGIGIPTLVTHYVEPDTICFQTENGLLGVGSPPEAEQVDPNLVDAAKKPVTERLGAAFFDSAASFAMIRGGHIDAVVLGALEVDEQGRVANWTVPGKPVLGVGGAMDLMVGARNVIVVMTHNARDGSTKLVRECTLPLTTPRPVDWVVTELAMFRVEAQGLVLKELAPGVTEDELKGRTGARYSVSL
ncbi:MAG: 3-oxoacid CoA-transferase subunit B [Desulfuromonadales bacterium]